MRIIARETKKVGRLGYIGLCVGEGLLVRRINDYMTLREDATKKSRRRATPKVGGREVFFYIPPHNEYRCDDFYFTCPKPCRAGLLSDRNLIMLVVASGPYYIGRLACTASSLQVPSPIPIPSNLDP